MVAQHLGETTRIPTPPVPETPEPQPIVPPPPPPAPEGMVLIPAGEFEMGSNDGPNNEQPVHTVYVDAFYMDKYEVTNLDYKKFVLANPQWQKDRIRKALHNGMYLHHWTGNNYPTGKANHPVTYVNWYAAMAYAKWAGKRLPTEAEWEKAARGGKSGLKYPWGNTISRDRANYNKYVGDTTAVGKYLANGYGLYDMAGNVWEWCLDAYDENFYFSSPPRNPLSDVNTLSNANLIIDDHTNVKGSPRAAWRLLVPYSAKRAGRLSRLLFAARHERHRHRLRFSLCEGCGSLKTGYRSRYPSINPLDGVYAVSKIFI